MTLSMNKLITTAALAVMFVTPALPALAYDNPYAPVAHGQNFALYNTSLAGYNAYNRNLGGFVRNPNFSTMSTRAGFGLQRWGARHPVLKRTAQGAGLGALAGGVVGLISGRGRFGKGLLIGAGSGAALGMGLGFLQNNRCLRYGAC